MRRAERWCRRNQQLAGLIDTQAPTTLTVEAISKFLNSLALWDGACGEMQLCILFLGFWKTCLCSHYTHARTHARAHTHTYYISVLIDFGETQFENHAVFFSQTPWHLVPLRFMYSPQYLFLEYFLSIWLPQYDKRSFRTVQNKRQKSVMKGRRV